MKKSAKILLILIACVCFGVALYYPISQYTQGQQNLETMDKLAALRNAGLQNAANATAAPETEAPAQPTDAPEAKEPEAEAETAQPEPALLSVTGQAVAQPEETAQTASKAEENDVTADPEHPDATPAKTEKPTEAPSPSPTPDRHVNTGVKSWGELEKVALDESKILPQYQELYALNNEMVGWMTIPGTYVDYPVMQRVGDEEYYLNHDFFGQENENGLLILDMNCDQYTPSYNLVVSGHNRWNKQMFSNISDYQNQWYWRTHKLIQFDSLMEERTYVVFAAFFAANYADDEVGFRYNADIQYSLDADRWLAQVREYQMYDTGIDVAFGDEFLTLTTCNNTRRKNGRFVVVARRVREGETFE